MSPGARMRDWWGGLGSTGRARFLLGLAALALVGVLIFGRKPWDVDFTPGRVWKVRDYVAVYFWAAALLNLPVLGILAWLAPRWAPAGGPAAAPSATTPRWFWPGVLAAALVLGTCALPRMGQSLWHDEASRVKRTMVGEYKKTEDGRFVFRSVKWERALFDSDLPNHVLQSALSKLCHDVWRAVAPARGFAVSEAAIRVPSLAAGVAGVVLLALLLKDMGFAGAGVAAAWVLALHPWYLKYAAEARGYAIVMAMVPLMLLGLWRAVMSGRSVWWFTFGAAQFAMMYAYVTAVFVPLVVNMLAPPAIFSMRGRGLDVRRALWKWLVACVLSGAAFIQMFLPNAPQLLAYVKSERGQGLGNVMGMAWFRNVGGQMWTGIPWSNTFQTRSDYIELLPLWAAAPWAGWLAAGVTLVLVALGTFRLLKRGPLERLAAATFVLPAPLCIAETMLRKGYLYEWYVIFALPGLVALVCLGGGELLGFSSRFRPTAAVLLIAAGALFLVVTQPMYWRLITRSPQPYREAVLAARPSLDPNAPGQDRIWTAFVHAGPLAYDPRKKRCHTVAEMRELMLEADAKDKELFFIVGYLQMTRNLHPSKLSLLESEELFEDAGLFRGQHPELSLQVFRYRAGSAKDFDFSAVPEDEKPPARWINYY